MIREIRGSSRGHAWRRGLVLLLGILVVLLGGTGLAQAAKPIAVGTFEGSFGEDVRAAAVAAINDAGQLKVVKDEPADRVGINEPKGNYKDKAHELGVAGILVGNVSDKGGWSVVLAVYGPTGELLKKFKMKAANVDKLNAKVRALLPEPLAELLEDIEAPKATGKAAVAGAAATSKKEPEEPPAEEPATEEEPVADEAAAEDEPKEEPPPEDEAADEEPDAEDEADDADDTQPGLSPLELHLELGYASRSFSYVGSETPNLDISNGGWAWVSTVRVYPAALFTSGFVGNLGFEVGVEQGFPHKLSATFTDPEGDPLTLKFNAETLRLFLGPRLRIPFSSHELGIVAGYGKHEYLVYGDENLDAVAPFGEIDPCYLNSVEARDVPSGGSCVVPDVKYEYVRLGVDSRFMFGNFGFGVRGGYSLLLESGEIERSYWFNEVSGGAFDAGVMVGYALSDSLFGMVGFDYRQYNLKFDDIPPERASGMEGGPVATGARDVYLHGWAGLAVIVPGLD